MRQAVGRALLVVILAISSLTACNSSHSDSAKDLTWFMWSGSQQEVAAWKHVAAMVTKRYPGIHVHFTTATFSDYFTKLVTLAASNSLPCLISVQAQRVPGVGSLFAPVNTAKLAPQFNRTIMQSMRYAGKTVALPYDIGPYLIYYNKTEFEKHQLPLPRPGWTVDEFLRDAKALTGHGQYGFAVTGYPDHWLPFALSRGANYLNHGDLQLGNTPLINSLGWVGDLVHKRHVAPGVPSTPDQNWDVEQWQSGSAAMVIDGPWDLINDKQVVKFKFGIAPMPAVDGHSATLEAGSGFGIAKSCPAKPAAWKALQVLTSPAAERYLAQQGRAFPARTAQEPVWFANAVPGAQTSLNAALKTSRPFVTTSKWDETSTLLFQNGVDVLNGTESAGSVLKNVQSQLGD